MKRTRKIKRYNRIYRSGKRRVSALQVILITVGCLALFFVGFSVIGPISDYLSGRLEPAPTSTPTTPVSDTGSQEDTSEVSSEVEPEATVATHSVYLPASAVQNSNELNTLISQLQALDINNVVLELKDEEGIVYYDSQVEAAQNAGVISSNPVDLASVIQQFHASGITVTAKLHAFQDDPAAKYLGGLSASTDAVVRYKGDTSYVWVDAAVNNGGKRWLNPYSDAAQKYITDLSNELVSMGCTNILLDSVQFPSGEALDMTDYGSKQDTMTKQEVLQGFISNLEQDLSSKGAKLIVQVPAMAAIEEQENQYGGNVLALGAQNLALAIFPSELGNSITVGEQTISSPAKNPAETVQAILSQIKTTMGNSSTIELFAVLETENNTKEQVEAQKSAIETNGVTNYILYNAEGNYQF